MTYITHAKENENTKTIVFRIWSTLTKSYVTDEMTEKQVRQWWWKKIIRDAIVSYHEKIDAYMRGAKTNGTSDITEGQRGLKEWKKESQ
jgi:hypothetical protein